MFGLMEGVVEESRMEPWGMHGPKAGVCTLEGSRRGTGNRSGGLKEKIYSKIFRSTRKSAETGVQRKTSGDNVVVSEKI